MPLERDAGRRWASSKTSQGAGVRPGSTARSSAPAQTRGLRLPETLFYCHCSWLPSGWELPGLQPSWPGHRAGVIIATPQLSPEPRWKEELLEGAEETGAQRSSGGRGRWDWLFSLTSSQTWPWDVAPGPSSSPVSVQFFQSLSQKEGRDIILKCWGHGRGFASRKF